MTAEHLLVVDLRELRAGRIVGQKRQATITYQMDQTFRVPDTCPACREDWQADSPNPIEAFVRALRGLIRQESATSPYAVRFEMTGLPDSRPRG